MSSARRTAAAPVRAPDPAGRAPRATRTDATRAAAPRQAALRTGARAASPPARPDARLERIWVVVAAIPRGGLRTYGAIAATAGLPGRARLVGRALALAPARLRLPWHRVVAAGGRIAFPPGSAPHREQARRLAREGHAVVRGRVRLPPEAGLDALLWGPGRC